MQGKYRWKGIKILLKLLLEIYYTIIINTNAIILFKTGSLDFDWLITHGTCIY